MTTRLLRRKLLEVLNGAYISLHTDDPGVSGSGELAGGLYARQLLRLADSGVNAEAVVFDGMPQVTGRGVTHIGLWDSPRGGGFLQGAPLDERKQVNRGDPFVFEPGALRIEF